eukprot:jgi/Chrzof1/4944/Cz15g05150.t1
MHKSLSMTTFRFVQHILIGRPACKRSHMHFSSIARYVSLCCCQHVSLSFKPGSKTCSIAFHVNLVERTLID